MFKKVLDALPGDLVPEARVSLLPEAAATPNEATQESASRLVVMMEFVPPSIDSLASPRRPGCCFGD